MGARQQQRTAPSGCGSHAGAEAVGTRDIAATTHHKVGAMACQQRREGSVSEGEQRERESESEYLPKTSSPSSR